MAHLAIRLLGPFEVTRHGEPVTQFETLKTRALLAYLAAEAPSLHRREALAEMLWPNRPEGAARANLRHTLRSLRLAIGDYEAEPPFLITTREAIALSPDGDVCVDVRAFDGSLPVLERMEVPDLEALEKALAPYRGAFLEDLCLPDSALFEEWRVLKREQVQRRVLNLLSQLVAVYEHRGEYERALAYAWRRLELEPWDETAHRQVMRLLARCGRRAEALAQYEACRHLLAQDLDVDPAAETIELYEQIQRGELGPTVANWDLPASPTPFFGRTGELALLEERLTDPDTRLVTIMGPGGSGKTRLALEAGTRLAKQDQRALAEGVRPAFAHGAVFVPLAAVDTAEGLVPAVADALELRLQGGREQLLAALRHKQLLLILDNVEHLLAGVGLVAEILRAAPGVQMLATSRERLQLQGEHVVPLGGLAYPEHHVRPSSPEAADLESFVAAFPALQLLMQTARRIQPRFALGAEDLPILLELCHQMDGLPLALELAASWADALSLRDILAAAKQSLDFLQAEQPGLPERHHSIRAVFDASWWRIGPAEQAVFSRLSVFRGGFAREAARQVVCTEATPRSLAALVRKSFLQYDQPNDRYQLHELLRQYAALQLAQDPGREAETLDRHSRHYCAWMESLAPDLRSRRQDAALAQLGVELENARAACLWAAAQGCPERIIQAADTLGWYYRLRDAPGAGEVSFRALAETFASAEDGSVGSDRSMDMARAHLRLWQSLFASILADYEGSKRFAHDALAILDSPTLADQDTRSERAFAWMELGYAVRETNPEEAQLRFYRSQQLYEEAGDLLGVSDALVGLGRAARYLRKFGEAERAVAEALRLRREAGDKVGSAEATSLLGHIALWNGEFERAESLLRQVLTRHDWSNFWLGHSLLLAGRFEEARAAAADAIVAYSDMGQRRELAHSMAILAQCHQHLGDYQAARVDAQEALALAQSVSFPRGIGLSLGLLGALALGEGAYVETDTHCTASLSVWQQSSGHPSEFEGELACLALAVQGLGHREEAWAHLRAQLGWAQESQMLMPALFGLVAAARLLADVGEIERAAELYALALRFPLVAKSRWFADVAGNQVAAIAAALPAERVAELQERGRARDLDATMEELLSELRG